ncbi:MAG: antitoxin CptB [Saprospiraceae bacterium]|jgi:antitoxin CptB
MSSEHNLNKLAWRARRGTKELDSILQGFLNTHFAELAPQQQSQFALLLEQSDPDIVDWMNGVLVPEDEGLVEIIALINERV